MLGIQMFNASQNEYGMVAGYWSSSPHLLYTQSGTLISNQSISELMIIYPILHQSMDYLSYQLLNGVVK